MTYLIENHYLLVTISLFCITMFCLFLGIGDDFDFADGAVATVVVVFGAIVWPLTLCIAVLIGLVFLIRYLALMLREYIEEKVKEEEEKEKVEEEEKRHMQRMYDQE